jgi:hypothetical protein
MSTEIHNQIKKSFSEFVEDSQAPELTSYFLKMAEDSKFDEKAINKSFGEYLKNMDADDDMISEMSEKAMEILRDMIVPNKSTLYPSNNKKLKLSDIRKPSESEKSEEKFEKSEEKPEKSEEKPSTTEKKTVTVKKVIEKPKPVAKKSAPAKKSEEKEDDEEKEESSPESGKKSTKKGAKVAVRASGYNLFYHEIKKEVEINLEKDWKKKYADAPYTKNNTEVSREIGRLWEEMKEKQKDKVEDYNNQANEQNKKNNIVPRGKAKTPENEKRPLTGFAMFHKIKKDEVLVDYRKENNMSEDEKIKPTDAMAIVSKAWSEYKKDETKKAEMDRLAAEYNEEHGRKATPKQKDKASEKKTNPYLMFCENFREEYRATNNRDDPEFDVYAESREMNKKWKSIKDDADKFEAWKTIAHDENVSRGLVSEDETAEE